MWCFCFPDFQISKSLVAWPVVLRIQFTGFPELPVSVIHFLFQFSVQPFTWSSFNVFLYCWCMSTKNFGYFCVEVFKRFIDVRCFFDRFPVDAFYIIAQVIMVIMFVVTTLDCFWIVFDGVDFPHATKHVMITERQRERWRIRNISRFVCKYQVNWGRWILSYSCCSLDNLGKSQVVKIKIRIKDKD